MRMKSFNPLRLEDFLYNDNISSKSIKVGQNQTASNKKATRQNKNFSRFPERQKHLKHSNNSCYDISVVTSM